MKLPYPITLAICAVVLLPWCLWAMCKNLLASGEWWPQ